MLLHGISFFLESKRKSTSDHYRQWSGEWGLTSVDPSGGGGGTPLFGLYGYVPLNRVWFSKQGTQLTN